MPWSLVGGGGPLPGASRLLLSARRGDAPHFAVRLFVAVDLAAEATAALARLERPALRSVRWTTPEQWHVTVRFLGQVGEEELEGPGGLVGALDAVPRLLAEGGGVPLEAVMGPALAWFPGRQVLQVPVEGLEELSSVVASATAGWGEAPEHSFRGHLTVARTRARAKGPAVLAGPPVVARWPVGEIVLYSSALGPDGSRYEALHRVPLVG